MCMQRMILLVIFIDKNRPTPTQLDLEPATLLATQAVQQFIGNPANFKKGRLIALSRTKQADVLSISQALRTTIPLIEIAKEMKHHGQQMNLIKLSFSHIRGTVNAGCEFALTKFLISQAPTDGIFPYFPNYYYSVEITYYSHWSSTSNSKVIISINKNYA